MRTRPVRASDATCHLIDRHRTPYLTRSVSSPGPRGRRTSPTRDRDLTRPGKSHLARGRVIRRAPYLYLIGDDQMPVARWIATSRNPYRYRSRRDESPLARCNVAVLAMTAYIPRPDDLQASRWRVCDPLRARDRSRPPPRGSLGPFSTALPLSRATAVQQLMPILSSPRTRGSSPRPRA